MKTVIALILLLTLINTAKSQKKDYRSYHRKINKAEKFFFIEQKADSALYLYEEVFQKYNFIFVKDLINASQIALYTEKPYLKYIKQGFTHGLKIEHLKQYPLFSSIYETLLLDKELHEVYKKERATYLKQIDFDYLELIYMLAIKDQKEKHKKKNYKQKNKEITDKLIKLTLKKGFPGDKTIGIDNSTAFKEIGKSYKDLKNRTKNNKTLWYMSLQNNSLSSKYPLVILVHNPCAYLQYKDTLYKEMIKGNIHPRDIGLIYDNTYRFKQCKKSLKGAFFLNMFTSYTNLKNDILTNKLRADLYITSLEIDDKKKEYEQKHGFKLFSGFWNCR